MFELNLYYHAIEKSIVAFGNLFTGIHITKALNDKSEAVSVTVRVLLNKNK